MHVVPDGAVPEATRTPPCCGGVLIVEAHPIVGWTLARLVNSHNDLSVVATVHTLDAALPCIAAVCPDVLILGVDTDLDLAELRRIGELRLRYPRLSVVVLASEPSSDAQRWATAAGAAFVLKRLRVASILQSVLDARPVSANSTAGHALSA